MLPTENFEKPTSVFLWNSSQLLDLLFQARARSSGPAALLPAPSLAASEKQSSSQAIKALTAVPLPLTCLDLASSSASTQLLRKMFSSSGDIVPSSAGSLEEPSTALALPSCLAPLPGRSLGDVGVQLGLKLGLSMGIGLEERLGLGLDRQIARTIAEVEERVNKRVSQLKAELQRRETELEIERAERERLKSEKQEVEDSAAYLSRQVNINLFIYFNFKQFIIYKNFLILVSVRSVLPRRCRSN